MSEDLSLPLDESRVADQIVPMTTRAMVSADYAFVFGTWLQGHYEKSNWAKGLEWEVYKNHHHALIEEILDKGKALVACDPGYENQIYGYIVYYGIPHQGLVLHYVYTKGPFRRFGVANHLMAEAGFTKMTPFAFTQLNNQDVIHDLRKKWPLARYNPYLLTR